MSINDNIEKLTDGKIGYRGGNSTTGVAKEIVETTERYCAQPLKDQNNTFYENEKRVEKVQAVTSLIIADHVSHKQQNMFEDIVRNPANQQYLSYIGYGNAAQTAANNMLSNATFSCTDVSGQLHSGFKPDSFSSTERMSLMNGGSFSRTIDGHFLTFKPENIEADKLSKALRAADAEYKNNKRVLGATGLTNQVEAMGQMRSASLSRLKSDGIDIGKGTAKDLAKAGSSLKKELDAAIKTGDKTKAATLQSKIDKLDSHKSMFGGTDQARSRQTSRKSIGMRLVKQNMLGGDIYQGMRTSKMIGKATTMSVKTAARITSFAAYKAEGLVAKAIPGMDNLHKKHGDMRTRGKEKAKAKKNGTYKEYKTNERARHANNRFEKQQKRDARFEKSQTKLRNKGNSKRADNRDIRRRRKKDRRDKFAAFGSSVGGFFGKVVGFPAKIWDKFQHSKFMKAIRAPWDAIGIVKDVILHKIIMPILVAIGTPIIVVLIFCMLVVLIFYMLHFIADAIRTDFTGALNNINYVQKIVDLTAEDLGGALLDVAKVDAENHFLSEGGSIPSDGLAWTKAPTDGELGSITSAEDGKELPGINANLLPIVSVMHYRFEDTLNFDNWLTARAYVYYLYVYTHHVKDYAYADGTDCEATMLYSPDESVTWDVETQKVTRPKELCNNLYIHGYDSELNKSLNAIKASMSGALNTALSFLGFSAFDSSAYGVFDGIPYDDVGVCDHYMAVQGSTTPSCGKEAHVHTDGCYGYGCGMVEHVHTPWVNEENPGCYKKVGGHIVLACGKKAHTHTSACWGLTCTKEVHTHTPWTSEENPGCYPTKYICLGHCGGHIIPQINMELDMTYAGIAKHDFFKIVYFLGESDFDEDAIRTAFGYKSVAEWTEFWDKKMAGWFFPFPSSPSALLEKCIKDFISSKAALFDEMTKMFADFISGEVTEDDVEDMVEADAGDDKYDFKGWYADDGSLDMALIKDLESFYGTYETDYEEGVKAWEDFDVVFPAGTSRPMTISQKKAVLEAIERRYGSISESRASVVSQAMDYVGKFWYDLSVRTGTAASTSGRIDCSGFVSSVLRHAIGWAYDWTASGFASAGTEYGGSPASLRPGDILAKNRTSSWSSSGWSGGTTNHVIIFIGYLDEGVPGYPGCNDAGYYIIDCSASTGGSTIRKFSDSDFTNYPYVYRGCY